MFVPEIQIGSNASRDGIFPSPIIHIGHRNWNSQKKYQKIRKSFVSGKFLEI